MLNEPSSLVGSVLEIVPIAEFAGKFETDHRRHAGQLNWQHAYHHFHNCDPKHIRQNIVSGLPITTISQAVQYKSHSNRLDSWNTSLLSKIAAVVRVNQSSAVAGRSFRYLFFFVDMQRQRLTASGRMPADCRLSNSREPGEPCRNWITQQPLE